MFRSIINIFSGSVHLRRVVYSGLLPIKYSDNILYLYYPDNTVTFCCDYFTYNIFEVNGNEK